MANVQQLPTRPSLQSEIDERFEQYTNGQTTLYEYLTSALAAVDHEQACRLKEIDPRLTPCQYSKALMWQTNLSAFEGEKAKLDFHLWDDL